jgi:phage baseplate assembly protein W
MNGTDESYLAFPFRLAADGAVARADRDQTIRARIEQVLFTASRERVMLPEFGCGVRDLVFQANGEALAAATEFTVARALQTYLGNDIMVNAVDVRNDGEKLLIEVAYTKSRDLERESVVFQMLPFEGNNRG